MIRTFRSTVSSLPALALAGGFAARHGRAPRRRQPQGAVVITNVRIFDGTRVIPQGDRDLPGGQDRRRRRASGRPRQRPGDDRRHAARRCCPASSTATPTPGGTPWSARSSSASPPSSTCSPPPTSPARCARSRRRPARPDRADLYSAGILATAPGGHGTEYGMAIPTLTKPEEAQAWVDARIAEGSDYIKIIDRGRLPLRPHRSRRSTGRRSRPWSPPPTSGGSWRWSTSAPRTAPRRRSRRGRTASSTSSPTARRSPASPRCSRSTRRSSSPP